MQVLIISKAIHLIFISCTLFALFAFNCQFKDRGLCAQIINKFFEI